MTQISEYIAQINTRNYNSQCKYIKKKLLSVDSCYINCIIFFKNLHVILRNLPSYFVDLNIKINEKKRFWFTFRDELCNDT